MSQKYYDENGVEIKVSSNRRSKTTNKMIADTKLIPRIPYCKSIS